MRKLSTIWVVYSAVMAQIKSAADGACGLFSMGEHMFT